MDVAPQSVVCQSPAINHAQTRVGLAENHAQTLHSITRRPVQGPALNHAQTRAGSALNHAQTRIRLAENHAQTHAGLALVTSGWDVQEHLPTGTSGNWAGMQQERGCNSQLS